LSEAEYPEGSASRFTAADSGDIQEKALNLRTLAAFRKLCKTGILRFEHSRMRPFGNALHLTAGIFRGELEERL